MKSLVLYVDDDAENLSTLKRVLRDHFEVVTAQSAEEALARMERDPFPVVVADQRMPKITGIEFLKKVSKKFPDTTGILLTAYSDMDALIEGVNAGVIYRYLTKPWKEADLLQALKQAYERFHLLEENRRLVQRLKSTNQFLKKEIEETFDFSGIAGADQGLKAVTALIAKVAPTQSN